MRTSLFLTTVLAACSLSFGTAATLWTGAPAGKVKAQCSESAASIGNRLFTATYNTDGSSVTFGGLKAADGTLLLEGGTPLFTIRMQDGRVFDSTNMKTEGLRKQVPEREKQRIKPARQGKEHGFARLSGSFTAPDGSFTVQVMVALREDSHYLRQSLTIRPGNKPFAAKDITALEYQAAPGTGKPSISGNTTHGRVVVNDQMFFGLETPMSLMMAGKEGAVVDLRWTPTAWQAASFGPVFNLPDSFRAAYGEKYATAQGPVLVHLKQAEGPVSFAEGGDCRVTFQYKGGNHKLNIVAVQLLDAQGQVISEDVHEGRTGHQSANNSYSVKVPRAGHYSLRYWVETKSESIASHGNISLSLPLAEKKVEEAAPADQLVRGIWQREAKLQPGQSWSVTGVVGLFAPGQQRRSFLAYIERERAVPYRPFIHYNDWYEIGIRVHDFQDPKKRTNEAMWLDLLETWNRELYTKRHTHVDGFIVDDGWDEFNSLWDFHIGFPNGFARLAQEAAKQKAGIGTWLGPVGGYGPSKRMRLANWNRRHPQNKIDNFHLSNKEYFNAFVGRCRQMIKDYGMRYFKFDGISTKYHAMGPANIEDAEGILSVIRELRATKPDIFINATVGTWASPFWYMHADSIWRQEDDFRQIGNAGDARDRWITYRDRLVHEVFVEGAPLFPINSLMTHGTIITKNGPPHVMSRDPENCRKEIRMAFGCGSALQEIYADHDLLNQQGGILWDELAACIKWVRRNRDVLPDVHWVGGNPWDNDGGDIYGYAAWNREKCTLTLRNSSASRKTLRTTLRRVFDVPPGIKGTVTLRNSFADQRLLPGLTNKAVDVDTNIDITLEPLEVFVLEGVNKM